MGCDIHSHAEKQADGKWVHLDVQAFRDRNYGLFGWLADVRNYSAVAPIAAERGVPADASTETLGDYDLCGCDAHSASWVGVAELSGVNYAQIIEDRRTIKQLGPNFSSGAHTCEPGEGERQTLGEFLGAGYFATLKRLRDAGAERIVFWFDN